MREKTIYEKIAEKYNTTPEEVRREMQIVMEIDYVQREYNENYDICDNPEKFELHVDGEVIN